LVGILFTGYALRCGWVKRKWMGRRTMVKEGKVVVLGGIAGGLFPRAGLVRAA